MTSEGDKLFSARVIVGVIVPVSVLVGVLTLYFHGSPFKCVFYEATGLYCPGCGAGRAATALVHLKIGQALRYNALFVFFGLPCLIYGFVAYLRFVFGFNIPLPKYIPNKITITITVIIILYWILRNIGVYPFTMLAPHA